MKDIILEEITEQGVYLYLFSEISPNVFDMYKYGNGKWDYIDNVGYKTYLEYKIKCQCRYIEE